MDHDLAAFFSRHTSRCEETVAWGDLQLQVNSYLCAELPPLTYITSARTLLIHQGEILVVRDPYSQHILPGGRIEPGESLLETLRREVSEETGWTLQSVHYLGIKHFHHLTPRPPDYPYPYPDFLQAIYVSQAGDYHEEAREKDGYELETTFQPLKQVQSFIAASERVYLEAALKWANEES